MANQGNIDTSKPLYEMSTHEVEVAGLWAQIRRLEKDKAEWKALYERFAKRRIPNNSLPLAISHILAVAFGMGIAFLILLT